MGEYIELRRNIFNPKSDFSPPKKRDRRGTFNSILFGKDYVLKTNLLGYPYFKIETEKYVTDQVGKIAPSIDVLTNNSLLIKILKSSKETDLKELAKTLHKVHSIKGDGFGWIVHGQRPTGIFDSWLEYLNTKFDDHISYCENINAISKEETKAIVNAYYKFKSSYQQKQPVLLHNDLNKTNIFYNDICQLIDWEDAILGDPIFDLANWGTFNIDNPLGLFKLYEAKNENRFWFYFLRIALMKTVHRHRFGYKDQKGMPPASQRIQLALKHLE